MFRRVWHMVIKEFLQLGRDPRARFLLIAPPVVQMLAYGYAANFDVHHVSIAVLDFSHSQESRELLSRLTFSQRFTVAALPADRREMTRLIDRGKVTMGVQIYPDFAELLRKGRTAQVQVALDGTNSNTALIALGYLNQIAAQFANDYAQDRLRRVRPNLVIHRVNLEPRPWYNPDLNSQWFFVPGVIGSVLLVMVVNMTAFAIVREREIGTLEQIIVTPIRRWEFILGKTLPFFIVGLGDAALVTLVGTLWFRVPFRGDLLALTLGTVLFLLSSVGMGLLISTLCSTQQQAFASSFFFLMPAFMLSGFSFPISSMPPFMRWLTYLIPLRFFLVIVRGTFL
jgi:ABC-2 type transport system permease protein